MALWLCALRCSEFLSASRATEPRAILYIKATDDPGNLLVASFIGSPAMNFLIGRAQSENNALCVIRKRHMIGPCVLARELTTLVVTEEILVSES
jgi:ABC-type sugar transport system ATPase subunit